MLGFSQRDQRCSLTCCIIPGYWPHVVTSNMALHGNVVSLEAFVRVMVASLPQARLSTRFPDLQPVFEQMMRLAGCSYLIDEKAGQASSGFSLAVRDFGSSGSSSLISTNGLSRALRW